MNSTIIMVSKRLIFQWWPRDRFRGVGLLNQELVNQDIKVRSIIIHSKSSKQGITLSHLVIILDHNAKDMFAMNVGQFLTVHLITKVALSANNLNGYEMTSS